MNSTLGNIARRISRGDERKMVSERFAKLVAENNVKFAYRRGEMFSVYMQESGNKIFKNIRTICKKKPMEFER
jgi:hypothetical protein